MSFEAFFDAEWGALGVGPLPTDPTDTGNPPVVVPPTDPAAPADLAISTMRVPSQIFDITKLGSGNLRKWYDTAIGTDAAPGFVKMTNSERSEGDRIAASAAWNEVYRPTAANKGVYWKESSYGGVTFKEYIGPNCGAYFLGRRHGNISFTLANLSLRASKDLIFLDVAAEDGAHILNSITKNAAGFYSLMYGSDPQQRLFFGLKSDGSQHPDNTAKVRTYKTSSGNVTVIAYANTPYESNSSRTSALTTNEVPLEESLALGGYMMTALACHVNRDRFSPKFEPVGSRPANPAYYGNIADKGCEVFESIRANWKRRKTAIARYSGSVANNKEARLLEMPLAIQSHLVHPTINEILAYVCYAKIKGGANWKSHWAYLEAEKAWNMLFGPLDKVDGTSYSGKTDFKCQWYEAEHPTLGHCIVYAHTPPRWGPSSTKDVNGLYLPISGIAYTHKNDYTGSSYGAIMCMKLEGCDFVTDYFMEGLANTVAATCLGEIKYKNPSTSAAANTAVPYNVQGRSSLNPELVSPWGSTDSDAGSNKDLLSAYSVGGLIPWDKNSKLADHVASEYGKSYAGRKNGYPAVGALMLHNAILEGKL